MRTEHFKSPEARTPSAHEASLHSATSDLQRELEQLVASFDLTSPDDYRRFLLASAAALLALETLLENSGAVPPRKRTRWQK